MRTCRGQLAADGKIFGVDEKYGSSCITRSKAHLQVKWSFSYDTTEKKKLPVL